MFSSVSVILDELFISSLFYLCQMYPDNIHLQKVNGIFIMKKKQQLYSIIYIIHLKRKKQ